MRLAIVENELPHFYHLQAMLNQWSQDQTSIEVFHFSSGEDILSSNLDFDLVFMDIQMDGIDGISTAHQLRVNGYNGEIVFLTSYSEYVFEGYEVRALNFFVKPVDYEKIEKCLNFVMKKLNDDRYSFKSNKIIIHMPYDKIYYFASANHYTQIVTTEGIYSQLESMKNIFATLPSRFIICHRTIIVNTDHILLLNDKELVLSNQDTVPVSNKYLRGVRSALLRIAENMI